jgi:adenosylhomocysteine nucleosidase
LLAILSATWNEIKHLEGTIPKTEEGKWEDLEYIIGNIHGKPVVTCQTGVGIRKARKGASFIIQKFKPELIISAGHGGALNPDLRVGDLVIGKWVLSLKKNEKRELAACIPDSGSGAKKGGILTENRFIHDPVEKRRLFDMTGALCVDMETWGVAEAATQSETPVLSVRSISDESAEIIPDMGSIYNHSGNLDKRKALKYIASRPSHLLPFIRFRHINSKKSTDCLNRFLLSLIQHV